MEQLKELHEVLFDIMCEFDRICRKHSIKYTLSFGTLLGAIRHKGFIPWDDDVDVMLDRNDYEKFCKICQKELDSEYFFQNIKTEKKYPYNISRIRKNNTAMIYEKWSDSGIHQGIYIDICPVDRIPDNYVLRCIQKILIVFFTPIRISRNRTIFYNGINVGRPFNKIIFILCRCMPKNICENIENFFITMFKNKHTKLCGIICEGAVLLKRPKDMEPFDAKLLDNYIDIEFNNRKFMISCEYDQLLKHWYGDYMKLPPENERKIYHRPKAFSSTIDYKEYIK